MFASCTLFSDNSQPLYDITVDNDSVGALYWLRRTLRVARGCISSAASDQIFNKKKNSQCDNEFVNYLYCNFNNFMDTIESIHITQIQKNKAGYI